jgi:hypothetical protein
MTDAEALIGKIHLAATAAVSNIEDGAWWRGYRTFARQVLTLIADHEEPEYGKSANGTRSAAARDVTGRAYPGVSPAMRGTRALSSVPRPRPYRARRGDAQAP